MLVPREMKLEHSGGVKAMTDEQIERSIELIKEMLAEREAGALHSRKGKSGRMHRDRNAGWRHRNGRAAWRRGPRGQPHFCLAIERLRGPPVGRTFQFQIFIQASSPEIWRKTIFGGEGGC